ncbi:TraK domain-containing protein [Geoalkalibacter subterraneus]|uniref:TraK C-terminal domain-containing protein n=1 Tax=Geoalkalibacter subterraneus TaxID=483547 RepID=A0A0B5FIV6_9BACT|nr:type-F conjugative transfer system secretin TraK [Geoalkalibacter subterraneus]AJF08127.1 hypothetical protein GSUB_16590 [Geoalkalibacter subterraneus]
MQLKTTFTFLTALYLLSLSCAAFAAPTAQDLPGVPLKSIIDTSGQNQKSPSMTPDFSSSTPRVTEIRPSADGQEESIPLSLPGVLKETVAEAKETADRQSTPAPSVSKKTKAVIPPGQESNKSEQEPESTRVAIEVYPGENMILPVANNHTNRLITPFGTAKVHTASSAAIEVDADDESIVYVTPDSKDLITMFVTEKEGDQTKALSLTLVPRAIPPREVRVLVAGEEGQTIGFSQAAAQQWEVQDEYTRMLEKLMVEIAKQNTPQGYGLRLPSAKDPVITCDIPGVTVETGQILDGHNMFVVVSKISNISDQTIEINERACYQRGMLAAAPWPYVWLEPGQATELYTIFRRPSPEEQKPHRPSLISQSGGAR